MIADIHQSKNLIMFSCCTSNNCQVYLTYTWPPMRVNLTFDFLILKNKLDILFITLVIQLNTASLIMFGYDFNRRK